MRDSLLARLLPGAGCDNRSRGGAGQTAQAGSSRGSVRRHLPAVLLCVLLLTAGLAGCVGEDASSVEPAATPEPAPADAEPPALVRETRNLTWDGYLPTEAVVCTPATCEYERAPSTSFREDDQLYELGRRPALVSGEFTLTWDSPDGEVRELLIGLVRDACQRGCDAIQWETGTSGVTIHVEDVNLSERDSVALVVFHPYTYYPPDGGVYHSAGPATNFTVTGTYQVLVPQGGS